MIKINLLPVRAARKKEVIKQQIAISIVAVVGVLAILFSVYAITMVRINASKKQIDAAQQEIDQLKKKIGEINNIKKLQAEVQKKLDILSLLRKEKTGPADRLAKLSAAAPEKLWLTKYSENGANVTMTGIALNDDLIAEFMRNLQASGAFVNVELTVSEQVETVGVKTKQFSLTCMIKNLMKKEEPAGPHKK